MSRIRLIDYMHMAHNARAVDAQMQATVLQDGIPVTIDTKILSLTAKNIFRQGDNGGYYLGLFLEGRNTIRKKYFAELAQRRGSTEGYKDGRKRENTQFYEDTNRAIGIFNQAGVSCYRYERLNEFGEPYDGLEADDLIVSMVQQLKEQGVTLPIDVVTNDSDLLPLVDDQVSVYLRGTRTHAELGCPEYNKYYQVTPENWEMALEYRSDYKGYYIPYNSMLLFKLIRGDKSDNYEGISSLPENKNKYGKVGYSKLMEQMVIDGVDFVNTFRYGNDFNTVMRPVLEKYFTERDIAHMYDTYLGIDMARVKLNPPTKMDIGKFQTTLMPFKINILV